MSSQLENPAHIVLSVVTQTIDAWKKENTPEVLKKKTKKLLDNNSEEIVYKLLGFDKDSWNGKWKLDHCNGRSGNSAAGDYIRKCQKETIDKWLAEVPLPTLKESMAKQITQEAERIYLGAFREAFKALVQSAAENQAQELFDSVSADLALKKYFKTINLLTDDVSSS